MTSIENIKNTLSDVEFCVDKYYSTEGAEKENYLEQAKKANDLLKSQLHDLYVESKWPQKDIEVSHSVPLIG